ncbi:MAG TPA: hypothetical protein VNY73_05745, partial [Bacteroidia bacterium]|nr:hypothetical protein [Bacteroidia bacterium]
MRKIFAIVFILSALQGTELFAQTDSLAKPTKPLPLCEVKMLDGTHYKGCIEKQNDSLIHLRGSSGVLILIPKKKVANIDFFNGHLSDDTTGARRILTHSIASYYYTTTSNAFLFNKGEVYGSSSYLVFHNVNYAFTRHFSLGL